MAEPSPPGDDAPSSDPDRKEASAEDKASHSQTPKPVERIQKLRLGVRAVWWTAVVLTLVFAGLALWLGIARGDPFAFFFAILAVFCAVAGYGTLLAVRRPSAS